MLSGVDNAYLASEGVVNKTRNGPDSRLGPEINKTQNACHPGEKMKQVGKHGSG